MRLFDADLRREYVRLYVINFYEDIPLPTEKGRHDLFHINLKGIPLSEESEGKIDWEHLVKVTEGYSGADICSVCRDASMMPMRRKMASTTFDIKNIQSMQNEIDIPLTM